MTIPFTTPGTSVRARTPIAGVLWRLAAVAALTVTAFAASASAASAGSHERILTKGGVVWFDHTGDYIAALDRREDGHAVRAYLDWWEREGDGYVHHEEAVTDDRGYTNGPADPDLAVYRKLFVPEGTTVELTMCYSQGTSNRQCSAAQSAKA
jgi:hypothetical protein